MFLLLPTFNKKYYINIYDLTKNVIMEITIKFKKMFLSDQKLRKNKNIYRVGQDVKLFKNMENIIIYICKYPNNILQKYIIYNIIQYFESNKYNINIYK